MSPDKGIYGPYEGENVLLSVLVPNGLFITVKTHRESTLYEVKEVSHSCGLLDFGRR